MLLPCEVAVKTLIPVIKALVAKDLTETHKLKQADIARLLGSTQPAISQYLRGVRGKSLSLDGEEIEEVIHKISGALARGDAKRQDIMRDFCRACITSRKEGLICDLHRRFETDLDPDTCQLCKSLSCDLYQPMP